MTVMTTLPFGKPLVRADMEDLPDDGHRYELIDGMLLVSPGPGFAHQNMTLSLYVLLRATAPRGLHVMAAPFAVGLAEDTEVQPDVLVARRDAYTAKDLPGAPLLAVEVLSPSTRRVDLLLKRDRYQAAAIPSYWLMDPLEATITVLDLHDGAYVETHRASGDQTIRVDVPFAVELNPARLLEY